MNWPEPSIQPLGGWALSTIHSASSYGIPVLVAPDGNAFGPGDLLSLSQAAEIRGTTQSYLRVACNRGSMIALRIGRNWIIEAREALRPAKMRGAPIKHG